MSVSYKKPGLGNCCGFLSNLHFGSSLAKKGMHHHKNHIMMLCDGMSVTLQSADTLHWCFLFKHLSKPHHASYYSWWNTSYNYEIRGVFFDDIFTWQFYQKQVGNQAVYFREPKINAEFILRNIESDGRLARLVDNG